MAVRFRASGPAFVMVKPGVIINQEGALPSGYNNGWSLLGFCERSPVMEFRSQDVGVLSSLGGAEAPSAVTVSTGDGVLSCALTRYNSTLVASIIDAVSTYGWGVGNPSSLGTGLLGYETGAFSVALLYPSMRSGDSSYRKMDVFPLCWPEEIVEDAIGAMLYRVSITFRILRYHVTTGSFDDRNYGSLSIGDAKFGSINLGIPDITIPGSI